MATQKLQVEGAREIEALLKQLGQEPARRALREGVRAGAQVVRREAIASAPRGDDPPSHGNIGHLAGNIGVKLVKTGMAPVQYVVTVGRAFWGMFQEFGTSSMPARPWFRPAFDKSQMAALEKIAATLAKSIEREALKLAGLYRTKPR